MAHILSVRHLRIFEKQIFLITSFSLNSSYRFIGQSLSTLGEILHVALQWHLHD